MGTCMSHRVEYPNDIHPNIFTVDIVGPIPKSRSVTKQSSNGRRPGSIRTTFRWSFKPICNSVTGHHGGGDDDGPLPSASYGQLEVTANNLIYHRKGHEPVSWPLHFVRRYGYENNLFSFESGRRCQWQGVFTFRCRKAQQLFVAVQTRVQDQSSNDDPQRSAQTYARHASTERCLRTSSTEENATNSNRVSDCISASRQRLSSHTSHDGHDDDESETNSQVFIEVTPAKYSSMEPGAPSQNGGLASLNQIRRRSILDSCGSSKTSNSTLPLLCDQTRPRSADQLAEHFDQLSRKETQITINLEDAHDPGSPSNPYYINVDTTNPVRNPSMRGASSTLCINVPSKLKTSRTRSISSDSKIQTELGGIFCGDPCCMNDKPTPSSAPICLQQNRLVSNYVNFPQLTTMEPLKVVNEAVDYTVVDLNETNSNYAQSRRTSNPDDSWTPSTVVGQMNKGHCRRSSANSTGGGQLLKGDIANNNSNNINIANNNLLTTNYVQIDCTKTVALRETAVQHRQIIPHQAHSRSRTQSAQLDATKSGQIDTDTKKYTANSYTDGVPVRRNKRECKLKP